MHFFSKYGYFFNPIFYTSALLFMQSMTSIFYLKIYTKSGKIILNSHFYKFLYIISFLFPIPLKNTHYFTKENTMLKTKT